LKKTWSWSISPLSVGVETEKQRATMPTDEQKPNCENLDQMALDSELKGSLLEAIAECLGDEVKRFALTRCGNRASDIEDIVQDAMLAAQKYLQSFRGDASLRTWLHKLVISACSHHRRGRKNDPELHRPLEEGSDPISAPSSNPEVRALISERLKALAQALEALNDEERQLLESVEWEELSMAEAAERYGLSVSAIKSRLFRIRRQLKQHMMTEFHADASF
jgi:RNA polymerase sigma-70 factor (ECF subfamily)